MNIVFMVNIGQIFKSDISGMAQWWSVKGFVRYMYPTFGRLVSKRRLGRDPTKPPHLLKCWVYQPNLQLLDELVALMAM